MYINAHNIYMYIHIDLNVHIFIHLYISYTYIHIFKCTHIYMYYIWTYMLTYSHTTNIKTYKYANFKAKTDILTNLQTITHVHACNQPHVIFFYILSESLFPRIFLESCDLMQFCFAPKKKSICSQPPFPPKGLRGHRCD